MFNFKKIKKPLFSKLYRYYCTKLLSKLWSAVVYFLLFVLIGAIQVFQLKGVLRERFLDNPSWKHKLIVFWVISFFQLMALWMTMVPLISYLVGRGLGWKELQKKQLFQIPKISREEDIKVLIFTPGAGRETVIWAKLAASLTYFVIINSLLTLIIFACLLFFTNFGVIAALLFLLINGIGLALVNFVLIVPYLFYVQEAASWLFYFFLFIFFNLLIVAGYFLRGVIVQYPLIILLSTVPFYLLAGVTFFSLYWQRFLTIDLD